MNATGQQSANSSLNSWPMAKAFTAWHLADENSRTANPNPPDSPAESNAIHINHLSQVLKDTGGYFYGGLNG